MKGTQEGLDLKWGKMVGSKDGMRLAECPKPRDPGGRPLSLHSPVPTRSGGVLSTGNRVTVLFTRLLLPTQYQALPRSALGPAKPLLRRPKPDPFTVKGPGGTGLEQ